MTFLELLNDWNFILTYIGPPLCGWIWWSARQRFAVKEDVAALSERVQKVEIKLAEVPDGDTMLKIQLALQELRGDMKAQDAKLDGVVSSVDALKNNTDMLLQHHLRGE